MRPCRIFPKQTIRVSHEGVARPIPIAEKGILMGLDILLQECQARRSGFDSDHGGGLQNLIDLNHSLQKTERRVQ